MPGHLSRINLSEGRRKDTVFCLYLPGVLILSLEMFLEGTIYEDAYR